jgi:DNA-binding GntR family transcriptional regulator
MQEKTRRRRRRQPVPVHAERMPSAPRFRKPPTAQEAVLTELRRRIAGGELQAGMPISDVALSAELGISRIPVREALNVLVGEGHITYRPHRGYSFTGLSIDDLLECYRLRQLLDEEGIRAAISRITDEDLDRLEVIKRDLERVATKSSSLIEMTSAHRQFHVALVEASGMPRLIWLLRLLSDATDAFHAVYYADPEHRRQVLDRQVLSDHDQIVRAMRARDAQEAIRVLRSHRKRATDRLREMFERDQKGSKK